MRTKAIVAVSAAVGLLGGVARADVKTSAPDGLVIQIKAEVALDRDDAWARLLNISAWWNASHTYSGDARAMNIDAKAGGCWCELWSGGEVEHGRVVMVMPKEAIRFDTALGPLQEMGVVGALTFTLSEGSSPTKTAITADFKVSGSSLSGLDKLAPVVDGVIAEQVKRFASGE